MPKTVVKIIAWFIFNNLIILSLISTPLFAKDKTTILRFAIWSKHETHRSLLESIAREYSENHPNVKIKYIYISSHNFNKTIWKQIEKNSPPDISWMREIDAPAFIASNSLVDLKAAVQRYDFADFSKSALQLWLKKDMLLGIPFSTSPFLILYNRAMFENAGVKTPLELIDSDQWNWNNIRKISKTIKKKTGNYAYQGVLYQDPVYLLTHVVRAFGGAVWDENGSCEFSNPKTVAGIQFYHNMLFSDQTIVPPGDQNDFFNGDVAMRYAQLSAVGRLKNVSWEWGIAPLPTGPAGQHSVIGQAALVVYKDSQNIKISMDFVAFMTSKRNVLKMSRYFPPARISVMNSKYFLESNPILPQQSMKIAVADQLMRGRILPIHRHYARINDEIKVQFEELWKKDADIRRVLENVCNSIQKQLKQ